MRRLSIFAACIVGMLCAAPVSAQLRDTPAAVPLPTTAAGWREAAERDIEAAYALMRDNHPGMVAPETPQFRRQLVAARTAGLHLARQVTTPMGYSAALSLFGNRLQDGHATVVPTLPRFLVTVRQWPGFVPAWRGSRMYVHSSAVPNAPRGAEIISCDGTAIRTLALRNVFPFRGRSTEAGNWWVQSRNVLIDDGNPFIQRPTTCQMRYNGQPSTVQLNWRAVEGQQLSEWRTASYNGVGLPIGKTTPANGISWIAMPDFQPDAEGVTAYGAVQETIGAQRSIILAGRAVVLDLRGNEGGSSGWSRQIAERLWGQAAVNAQMARYFARTRTYWRTSAGNEAHVRANVPGLRERGFESTADEWARLADQMRDARAAGRALIVQSDTEMHGAMPALVRSDFTTPVYVIVPGQCASACLDALDVFTRFPNTRLIGAPSSGDSIFMDIRSEALPSGLANVVIPNKIYVGRPRGHGVGYRPAIEVTALDWSTEDFLRVIERDLARRERR